jgi:predicted ATPase
MIKLKVTNWRCIENLELELSRINVFIGPNSTGKSSLAYAIYFASKSRNYDPHYLAIQLYGHGFDKIARLAENRPQFPISININGSEFSVEEKKQKVEAFFKTEEQEFEINRAATSPWTDEFLLPSKRVNYVQIVMLLPKIIRELRSQPQSTFLWMFAGSIFELFKTIPILPPFGLFASDYARAMTGIRLESVKGKVKDVGSYLVNIQPLFSLIELTMHDPYTKLHLPIELAPDGLLDFSIFDSITQKIPENSLVVIEEPEIYKNPLMVKDFTEHIVKRILDKRLTLIMTTHSDIPIITMGKLVTEKVLKPEEIKIYYFKRDPWTKVSEIKVYEDGTFENLPDTEKLISYLF